MTDRTLLRTALLCLAAAALTACGDSTGDAAAGTSSTASADGSTDASTTGTPQVAFSSSSYVVSKSASAAVVTLNRSGNASGSASAAYATYNDTAAAGSDYTATSGTVSWDAGDSSAKSISVPIRAQAAGKSFGVALTSVAGAAAFGSPATATVAVSTSSTQTSAAASATQSILTSTSALLSYITSLSGQTKHILVGQHSNYWSGNPFDIVTPIQTATGHQVSILGVTNDQSGSTQDVVSVSNTWLAQGGIVLISQWPRNPLRAVGSINFGNVVVPGTVEYNAWHTYLDAQIAKFKQIKGPVLYRPFVELNGSWSWWVPTEGLQQATFVKLWQQTHDYVVSQGVTNVLWLFNLNTSDPTGGKAWYPGNAYVDVVSLDSYPPSVGQDTPVYNFLVSTGKPLLYAEAGVHSYNNSLVSQQSYDNSQLLATIKTNFPKAFGVVIFCQNYAIPLQKGASAMLNDPAVVTLTDTAARSVNLARATPAEVASGTENVARYIESVAPAVGIASTAVAAVSIAKVAGSSTAGSSASGAAAPIQVMGASLVDASGNPVQLRGASISALEGAFTSPTSNYFAAANLGAYPWFGPIKNWRINTVRLPLNEAAWLRYACVTRAGVSTQGDVSGKYQQTVKQFVADATAAGLHVILDLHWSAPQDICPESADQLPDMDHSVSFWTSVANAFKGNPAVIFDLFSQPNAGGGTSGWQLLRDGGTQAKYSADGGNYQISLTWQSAGMQTLVSAVRDTGATNLIMISGLAGASDLSGWLAYRPTDPLNRLTASWHAYAGTSSQAANAQAILSAGIPVIIAETGDKSANGTASAPVISDVTSWADQHGASVLAWAWDVWSSTGGSNNLLIKDSSGTPTDGEGVAFKEWLSIH